MGLEDLAIAVGKELVTLGIRKLHEYMTDEEVVEVVTAILPAESKSRRVQREIEQNGLR